MKHQAAVPITSYVKLLINPHHPSATYTQSASPYHFPVVLVLLDSRFVNVCQGNPGLNPFRRWSWHSSAHAHAPSSVPIHAKGLKIWAIIIPGPSVIRNMLSQTSTPWEGPLPPWHRHFLKPRPRTRLSTASANGWSVARAGVKEERCT